MTTPETRGSVTHSLSVVPSGLFYEPTAEHVAKLSGPWCGAFSGGKDSTSLITWVEWLRRAKYIRVKRPQLVQSDTQVEDAALSGVSRQMMAILTKSGWECAVVEPRINEKLYNRILGIGNSPTHPGNRNMRWCSRSTKINPMKRWRKVNASGLTLTGLRWGESRVRDGKLQRAGCSAGGECGLPNPDDHTYSPIINWSLCQVIDWLNGSVDREVREVMGDIFDLTKHLVSIYGMKIGQPSFAEFGEPEIKAARFGCIGCPAISATREPPKSSIQRYGATSPLNELYDVWFEARRRVNRCYRIRNGKGGYGPIRMAVRAQLFARVMDIQHRACVILVTREDEAFIRDCWARKVYPRGWSEADEASVPAADPSHLNYEGGAP